ncbi:hypothetical protein [Pendulispora albinea]|uniref:Uncharacterized protein n=1 Tax=Pendulispora albinea TaxID=2741071 RepID=A0ABZ2LW35_9BACT
MVLRTSLARTGIVRKIHEMARDYSLLDPGEEPWDVRILNLLPSSIDETQLDENLKLTPEERLLKMLAALRSIEAARGSR